jgi:cobalt-zinc-cadmium efflux system outer membrane protein
MRVRHFLLRLSSFAVLWFMFWGGYSMSWARGEEQSGANGSVVQYSPEALQFISEEPSGVLTLKLALSLALMRSPELRAFALEIRGLEALTLQAGLLPNPEIEIEAEDFGGSGELHGSEIMETTIQLSQVVELGRKRSKRKQLAFLEKDLGAWDYESKRADLLAEVTKAFVGVLAAQERLALTKELVNLAEQMLATVSQRVRAGKVSPVEETRANVALSSAKIDLERAKRELEASRQQLAATWGSKTPAFEKAKGQFYVTATIPSAKQLQNSISQNPDTARWVDEMGRHRANVDLAQASGIPDVTLRVGAKHANENDDVAFVCGVSVPLPLFDRNQGGVLEARHQLAKAKEERQAAELRAVNDLARAYQSLSSAYAETTVLKKDVLPGAQSAFETSREGYRQGKFDYLVVLDAQRTLFETRGQYIEALNQYHQAVSQVERLIGTGLDTLKTSSSQQNS